MKSQSTQLLFKLFKYIALETLGDYTKREAKKKKKSEIVRNYVKAYNKVNQIYMIGINIKTF